MSIVLLLSRQRSGTGALASVLERHPDVSYAGEILDPSSQLRPFSGWLANRHLDNRHDIDPSSFFLEFIEELKAESQINIVDIKYNCLDTITPPFHSFCDTPWVLQILSMIPVPMIHLRRSPLETYASAKIAERAGTFHSTSELPQSGGVHIDIADFAEYFRVSQLEDRFFAKFFQGYKFHASLDYETCFAPDGNVSHEVMGDISSLLSLDLTCIDRMPRFVRQAPGSLAEKIANLEEVSAWLGKHGALLD